MADQIDSPEGESAQTTETGLTRRAGRRSVARAAGAASPKRALKPLRSLAVLSLVGGLIAAVALPAFGLREPAAEAAMTLQQVALDDAQTLVIASDVAPAELARSSYDATTEEEIQKKKAEEAAAARARIIASSGGGGGGSLASIDLSLTSPGSGEVRWPVLGASWASYNLFRPPGRPTHNGLDMMTGSGSPIFAASSGVVRTSTDGGGSYGVLIMIDSVVGGQAVTTTYAHMRYGSRVVSAGQWVEAGQLIGLVGQTGYATAPHLHFEVRINGSYVDPLPWLNINAG